MEHMQHPQAGKAETTQAEPVLIRAEEHKRIAVPGNPLVYEKLSPEGAESLAMFRVSVAPGQSTGGKALRHGGDESMFVFSGTVQVEVEGLTYSVGPGDSMFIPRGQRHLVTNVGNENAVAVFVLSPPAY